MSDTGTQYDQITDWKYWKEKYEKEHLDHVNDVDRLNLFAERLSSHAMTIGHALEIIMGMKV